MGRLRAVLWSRDGSVRRRGRRHAAPELGRSKTVGGPVRRLELVTNWDNWPLQDRSLVAIGFPTSPTPAAPGCELPGVRSCELLCSRHTFGGVIPAGNLTARA